MKKIKEEMEFKVYTIKHRTKCHSKLDLESYVHQKPKTNLRFWIKSRMTDEDKMTDEKKG